MMRTRKLMLMWWSLWCACGLLPAQQNWFPFTLPWDDGSKTVVDASGLLVDYPGQDPATVIDSRGFVRARSDGHFYFSKTGKRARFWGVNFTFGADFPDQDTADGVARHLAKLGVNVVRFHHMDYHKSPDGIWDPAYFPNDTLHLDSGQLDRLDYLIYQLRSHGIYVNLNLKVARHFGPGDDVPFTDQFTKNYFFRGVSHYDPRMIELQHDYARKLLGHLNPYTKRTYLNDPGVFCVEIANEDSFFGSLLTDGEINYLPDVPGSLPKYYSDELDGLCNDWLAKKYGTEEAIRAAWDPHGDPVDSTDRMRNGGFESGMDSWALQRPDGQASFSFTIPANAGPDNSHALRVVVDSDGINWHVQLMQSGHSIEVGKRYEISFYAKSNAGGGLTIDVMKGVDPWQNYGLSKHFPLTSTWTQYRAQFIANDTDPSTTRPTFELGETTNTIWIDQVEFREVSAVGLGSAEHLADQTIARPIRSEFGRYSGARILDLMHFYYELDTQYFTGMRRYLRNELGLKSLVTGTAPWWAFQGDSAIQSQLDFVDGHLYWDHPWWPAGNDWAPKGWVISNTAQVNSLDGLSRLASQAVAGKPFTVSEYNQPFPNQYALEAPLLIACVAAQQDWDAVYMFDYASSDSALRASYTTSFFSLSGNPVKTAQMPIASRIFLGSQLAPNDASLDVGLNLDELFQAYTRGVTAGDDYLASKGLDRASFLEKRLRIGPFDAVAGGTLQHAVTADRVQSPGGRLIWDRSDPNRTYVEVHGLGVEGAVGFLAGRQLDFDGWSAETTGSGPDHCAVLLQSLDGTPMRESRRLLLSIWTEHQNTNMKWNSAHTSVNADWGHAPTIIRSQQARVRFDFQSNSGVQVFPLDATGAREQAVPLQSVAGDSSTFDLDTGRDQTVRYEVEINQSASEAAYEADANHLFGLYTDPSGANLNVGWIGVEPGLGGEPSITALLEYSIRGVLTSMVRLPVTVPASDWWVPLRMDARTGTALALVNPSSSQTIQVNLRVLDDTGEDLAPAGQSVPLAPGGVQAFFLRDRFTGIGDDFVGSLRAQSGASFGLLVLRSTVNALGEYFLTPVSSAASPIVQSGDRYFAQVAAGPAYSMDLLFLNDGAATESFGLEFRTSGGDAIVPPGIPPSPLSLQPGGVEWMRLPQGSTEFYGYARLHATAGSTLPRTVAVITQWKNGSPISEVGVPALPAVSDARIVAPRRRLQWVALALMNPGSSPLTVRLTVLPDAADPERNLESEIELRPFERKSLFLHEAISGLPDYLTAVLEIEGDSDFAYLPLLGNYSSRGDFLLTALVDASAVTDPPVGSGLIGRFLSGLGYRTIVYATHSAPTEGVLRFFDETGAPLPVAFR